MENTTPAALKFSHRQRYVKLPSGSVKNIVVIQGSPRKTGVSKTEILTAAFIDGCRQAGAAAETINLREKKIRHCQGCFTCWTKTPGKCIFDDDVADIMKTQNAADLVVLASPLYHFGIISLLKKYIERTLPSVSPYLIERDDGQTTHPPREGFKSSQYLVIIGVCGFPEVSHFGAFSANFHYLANAGGDYGYNIAAEIYRPLSEVLGNPFYADENERVLNAARKAGYDLIRNGAVDNETIDEIAEVRVDRSRIYEEANKAWDACIQSGMTMPELQQKLTGSV